MASMIYETFCRPGFSRGCPECSSGMTSRKGYALNILDRKTGKTSLLVLGEEHYLLVADAVDRHGSLPGTRLARFLGGIMRRLGLRHWNRPNSLVTVKINGDCHL